MQLPHHFGGQPRFGLLLPVRLDELDFLDPVFAIAADTEREAGATTTAS